ncbi:MAG: hypothetical protein LBE76_00885, partial [Nitrososphaerota archaeon]|nr:hypothetical protein [Nitrososphaerota archaeon]
MMYIVLPITSTNNKRINYILCKGNTMMYIEDWFNQTHITLTPKMTDIDASKFFASITNQERKEFFKQWIKHRGEQEYIA